MLYPLSHLHFFTIYIALLVSRYGAPAERITAIGYGESRPVNSANNATAHRENRRIVGIVKATVESK